MTTVLQGSNQTIKIKPDDPVRLIGERINPSGKSKLRQALVDRNWDYIVQEAQRQVKAGAAVLDVNVGAKGINEAEVLPEVVKVVAEAVDVPLSIDTRVPEALACALECCPGRPLVNSIGGEEKILTANLPIIAEHQVPVIVLCMGQEGIPASSEERLRIADEVFNVAVQAGLAEEDIIFDPLVMTVGADDQAARIALETITLLRKEFPQNNITGGASNVSFGMPARSILNQHFLSAACMQGMNIPITDPTNDDLHFSILTSNIFLGQDWNSQSYMKYYRKWKKRQNVENRNN